MRGDPTAVRRAILRVPQVSVESDSSPSIQSGGNPRWKIRAAYGLLGVFAVLLLRSRTAGIEQSLWNDEAFSAVYAIQRGAHEIIFSTSIPAEHSLNNHRLFSLLAWATTSLFGESEVTYRLWGLIPGIGSVVLVVAWTIQSFGLLEGLLTACLIVTSPLHAELTGQARGYGLCFLGSALLLTGSSAVLDRRRRFGAAILATGGIVGIWTLPVFVVPFVAELGAVGFYEPYLMLVTLLSVALPSALFYFPVIDKIAYASHQQFGLLVGWNDVLAGPGRDLLGGWTSSLGWSASVAAPSLFVSGALLGGLALWRRHEVRMVPALVLPIVATYVALAAFGSYSVPRYVSYLLYHVVVLSAVGIVWLCRQFTRIHRGAGVLASGVVVAACAVAIVQLVARTKEQATLPIEDYRGAIDGARRAYTGRVLTNSHFGAGFQYYGRDLGIEFPEPAALQWQLCHGPAPFAYIHYPLYGFPIDVSCLRQRGAEMRIYPQRAGGFGGSPRVFVVQQ